MCSRNLSKLFKTIKKALNKKKAGRQLAGMTYDEMPEKLF
jgi:protein gp37